MSAQKIKRTRMHVSFYQQQPSQEQHYFRTICANGDISTPRMNWKPPSSTPFSQQQYQSGAKSAGQEKNLDIFKTIFPLMIFYFFNFIIAGRSAQLGISPPPEGMGNWQHHCPVANNITKKAEKGCGKKPCPPHFLPHDLSRL